MFEILKGFGRGIVGIVIWPISTALTLRRMCKLIRDEDIPCIRTNCSDNVDQFCCESAKNYLVGEEMPDLYELECMRYFRRMKYQLPTKYINQQKFTIFWYSMNIIIWVPIYYTDCYKDDTFDGLCASRMSIVSITIDSLMKFFICAFSEESYNTAVSTIKFPWRAFAYYKRLQCHDDIKTHDLKIHDLVSNSYFKARDYYWAWKQFVKPDENDRKKIDIANINSEILEVSNQFQQEQKYLKEALVPYFATDAGLRLEEGVISLVLNYYNHTFIGMVRQKNGITDRNQVNTPHSIDIRNAVQNSNEGIPLLIIRLDNPMDRNTKWLLENYDHKDEKASLN